MSTVVGMVAPADRPLLASRLAGIPPTIFSEMSALAVRTGAVNLGQGFPDVDGPASVVERAVEDPSIGLQIFTALTLEQPSPGSELERRFMEPASERLFGDYPSLAYTALRREGRLPANIEVREFFFLAGRWLVLRRGKKRFAGVRVG